MSSNDPENDTLSPAENHPPTSSGETINPSSPADSDSDDHFDADGPKSHEDNHEENISVEEGEDHEDLDNDWIDDDGEELTLDHLSAAYAKVSPDSVGNELPPSEETDSVDETVEMDDVELPADRLSESIANDNAGSPISPESIVESILFVGAPKGVKLTTRKIAAVLRDVSPKEVTQIVHRLNKNYDSENRPYRILNEKGHLKMALDDSMGRLVTDYYGRNKQVKLSQAAIDVLAVVAYNQPVTKIQVDKIRGKPSSSILSQLVKRKMLTIEPPENFEDKKLRYSTTERFLEFFGLDEIADLPQSHEISDIDELSD